MTVKIISAIFVTAFITLVSGECLSGWTHFDDSCYHLFRADVNYTTSVKACKNYNRASIASLETIKEHHNIHVLFSELNVGSDRNVWVGLTDIDNEMQWKWESTGQPISYSHWAKGEPNQGGSSIQQDCVVLYGAGGHRWADVKCEREASYLCETPFKS